MASTTPKPGRAQLSARLAMALAAGVAVGLGVASAALAGDVTVGNMTISRPWARATPGGAKTGAVYLTIVAGPAGGDRLVEVEAAAAARAELHSHTEVGGVMQMRRIDGVAVGPRESVVLGPGGHHIMLMDLRAPLVAGQLLPLTLVFEKAGSVAVEAVIEPIGARAPGGSGSGSGSGAHPR